MYSSSEIERPLTTLIIACGALAREILSICRGNYWHHVHLKCINADLHNRPQLIAGKVREKIAIYRHQYEQIFVILVIFFKYLSFKSILPYLLNIQAVIL